MHPVQMSVEYEERRSRLTTFFRYFCVLPHSILAGLWAYAAYFVSFIAWFAILFTGRMPSGMFKFISSWLRYSARVNSYALLISDKFPPFNGDDPYSVDCTIQEPEKLSRVTTFFRWIMAIPTLFIILVFAIGVYVVLPITWLVIMITGRAPRGLVDFLTKFQRYATRATAYLLLVTDRYPNFEDAAPAPAKTNETAAAW
jgi:hypothetical protein